MRVGIQNRPVLRPRGIHRRLRQARCQAQVPLLDRVIRQDGPRKFVQRGRVLELQRFELLAQLRRLRRVTVRAHRRRVFLEQPLRLLAALVLLQLLFDLLEIQPRRRHRPRRRLQLGHLVGRVPAHHRLLVSLDRRLEFHLLQHFLRIECLARRDAAQLLVERLQRRPFLQQLRLVAALCRLLIESLHLLLRRSARLRLLKVKLPRHHLRQRRLQIHRMPDPHHHSVLHDERRWDAVLPRRRHPVFGHERVRGVPGHVVIHFVPHPRHKLVHRRVRPVPLFPHIHPREGHRRKLMRQLRQMRNARPARTAPRRPKLHHIRLVRFKSRHRCALHPA